MSDRNDTSRIPAVLSMVAGLMLTMLPLPGGVEFFRPDWIALLVVFWAIHMPRTWSVGSAWIVGIVLDVSQGTLLGQHALALAVVAFASVRFHLLIRVFPLSQLTATVFALLALYRFLLFWINGVAGVSAPLISYWAPVLTGTLVWPLLLAVMSPMRYRTDE